MKAIIEQLARLNSNFERLIELLETKSRTSVKSPTAAKVYDAKENPMPLQKLWNEWKHQKMPRVEMLSPGTPRYRNALARWRETPGNEEQRGAYWTKVIRRVAASSFCRGETKGRDGRPFVADFDFLVRADRHAHVLEGRYDDKKQEEQAPARRVISYVQVGDSMEPVYG